MTLTIEFNSTIPFIVHTLYEIDCFGFTMIVANCCRKLSALLVVFIGGPDR